MDLITVREIYKNREQFLDKTVRIGGWVRSVRDSKTFGFIVVSDGSYFETLQVVYHDTMKNFAEVSKLNVGAAIIVEGTLVATPEAKQPFEIQAVTVDIEGVSASDYPLQKKRHSLEYLRTISHLRPRTNTFQAVFRVRSLAAYAIHRFFQEHDFVYVNTPLITGSDAEGAGEMFQVTTMDLADVPKTEAGDVDYVKDFFGKKTSLTVSGQLEGELGATAVGEIYTFGPTFRAENSNTPRHLAEFWMIEPEMAFYDINDNMVLAEEFVKYLVQYALDNCMDDLTFLNNKYDEGLIERLRSVLGIEFQRLTYTDAVTILEEAVKNGTQFEFPVSWGTDFQSEHERYLVEKHFGKPVILTDFPQSIKAFYMKQNDGCAPGRETVRGMDVLFPKIGEIIGGSEREASLEKLERRITELGMSRKNLEWYIDTRRFGTVPHSGFGLGFERLLLFVTGMSNIRDVIPFPRTPKNAEF